VVLEVHVVVQEMTTEGIREGSFAFQMNYLRSKSMMTNAILLKKHSTVCELSASDSEVEFHQDSNGVILANGDQVVLNKTLDVKGASANARVGAVVRGIRLVHDNINQIEGKIDGQQIVILTQYVRKGANGLVHG
ncbi:MAG: alkylphosphonate utilization protein, partial [Flavobacteriales bacterium]